MKYISVIITCYNRKEFLQEAIESALNQTLDRKRYEIIVVKNFNSDIDDYLSKNGVVTVFADDKSYGGTLAAGLKVSHGKVISLLDDDDFWSKDKLKYIYKVFRSHSRLGYYRNNLRIIGNGNYSFRIVDFLNKKARKLDKIKNAYITKGDKVDSFKKMLDLGFNFNDSSISIRRAILQGRTPQLKRVRLLVDNFLFCCALSSRYDLLANSERLTTYRVHESNVSAPKELGHFVERNATYTKDYHMMIKLFGKKDLNLREYMQDRVVSLNEKKSVSKFFNYLHKSR